MAGFLGGFGASPAGETDAEFDQLFERLTTEAFWCCFSWGDADDDYRQLPYQRPRPLTGGVGPGCNQPLLLRLLATLPSQPTSQPPGSSS